MSLHHIRRSGVLSTVACILILAACGNSTGIADPSGLVSPTSAPVEVTNDTPGQSNQTTTTSTAPELTTATTGEAVNDLATTESGSSDEAQPASYGLPDDYQDPTGWVESMTLRDESDGTLHDSSDDPRLASFVYRKYFAPLGSPAFPNSTDAQDLGDGLYYLGGFRWDPTQPNTGELILSRLVDCGGSEGEELWACDDYGFEPGLYAPLKQSQAFRISLDDRFTVHVSAVLEPVFEDEYYQSYSWLGQGPEFASLLADLHDVYTHLITAPTHEGATLDQIAAALQADTSCWSIFIEPWGPWAAWQMPGFPAFSYASRDIVPMCWYQEHCIDGGSTDDTARSFDSFISRSGSVHVVNGRVAMFYPGFSLGS